MSNLTSATTELLAQLSDMAWFENVGKPISKTNVPRAYSWKEAVGLRNSREQSNITNESKTILTENLCFEYRKRFQEWNKLVMAVRKIWDPISESKIKKVMRANELPKGFVGAVNWDIVSACMELEYADLVPPRFFKDRLAWYLAGHFPCGWEGDFPEGKLIVF